ncbi:RHS repeat-associated core domain-containing protein [Nannocystis pusilla]|uniref:RHS repeat-associated core domain-containing protein n=1 Tax=Nannocystis pusilla TaxID=889268 RepID=UPI003B80BB3E
MLDHRGRPVARDAAEPYGATRLAWRADDAAGPTYRFTGKEDDPLSSAVTIGARDYLPELGRWASPDPLYLRTDPGVVLSDPQEANPYGYVGGNPVTFTDPTGHKGVAHGSEGRPGVLDNFPDSPNAGFDGRMAAVEEARARGEFRTAVLVQAAVTVLDTALTIVDGAMTASDAYDSAAMVAGPVTAAGSRFAKFGIRGAIRKSKEHIRRAVKQAIKDTTEAAKRLASAAKPGRARRNAKLAGKAHPETGIPFDADARPDFSGVTTKEVEIGKFTNRRADKKAANKAAGFDKTPEGYEWHHHEDGKTMQLVPSSVHGKTGHDGPYSPH